MVGMIMVGMMITIILTIDIGMVMVGMITIIVMVITIILTIDQKNETTFQIHW